MYPPVEVYTHLHLPQVGLRPLQLIRSRVPGILPPRQEATIHPVKHSQARILFCIIVIPDTFRLDKLCFIKYKYINISANLINLASTFSLLNLFHLSFRKYICGLEKIRTNQIQWIPTWPFHHHANQEIFLVHVHLVILQYRCHANPGMRHASQGKGITHHLQRVSCGAWQRTINWLDLQRLEEETLPCLVTPIIIATLLANLPSKGLLHLLVGVLLHLIVHLLAGVPPHLDFQRPTANN